MNGAVSQHNSHEVAFAKASWKTNRNQLYLLLWKNMLLQKRSIISTLAEILLPALFAIILLLVRVFVASDRKLSDTTFQAFSIDSVNGTKWQSLSLAYCPNTKITQRIMDDVRNKLGLAGLKGKLNDHNKLVMESSIKVI